MIEIYCDESRPESLFSRVNTNEYMVLGGIWVDNKKRKKVKNKIKYLKKKHNITGEFKWTKVSPSKVSFYLEVIEYFFSEPEIRFRSIVVESAKVDMARYHNNDNELGFYKFYYQLLNKWCEGNEVYRIYLDDKKNKDNTRLPVLGQILNNSGFSTIEDVLAIKSFESVFIQLADLLTGVVSAKFNSQEITSEAKKAVINRVESYTQGPIKSTGPQEKNSMCLK